MQLQACASLKLLHLHPSLALAHSLLAQMSKATWLHPRSDSDSSSDEPPPLKRRPTTHLHSPLTRQAARPSWHFAYGDSESEHPAPAIAGHPSPPCDCSSSNGIPVFRHPGVPGSGSQPIGVLPGVVQRHRVEINVAMCSLQPGTRDDLTQYEKNGMSETRVATVLQQPCKGSCRMCSQPPQVAKSDLLECCRWWHGRLTAAERRIALNALYGGESSSSSGQSCSTLIQKRTQWVICGTLVCYRAFCALLGMGEKTARKYANGMPDMRARPKDEEHRQPRMGPQGIRVHEFFLELYHSAAECMPHESYMVTGPSGCKHVDTCAPR